MTAASYSRERLHFIYILLQIIYNSLPGQWLCLPDNKHKMKILLLVLLSFPFSAIAQQQDWISMPSGQWPSIAMINEVWYNRGERYVHSSFEYAATGFLIDTGKDTLAATVKHVLWIAKTKSMKTVDLNDLQRWIMHPKGNLKDSVVIDYLINRDSTEILEGPASSITQRDWLVFKTKYVSPNIQPLKPRFNPVHVGERVRYFGCPYNNKNCVTYECVIVAIEGNKIIFSMPKDANVGGASGSPIVDQNGFLVGILGGSSANKNTNEPALYGISTRYLQRVLTSDKNLNASLVPIRNVIEPEIIKNGINSGIRMFRTLKSNPENLFTYDFTTESLNSLGDTFLIDNKVDWAIAVYKLSLSEYHLTGTYLKLGNAYLAKRQTKKAKEAFENVLKLSPDSKEAMDALDALGKK
jgi:hypothetical protein